MAPGVVVAGFFIRTCMITLLSHRVDAVRHTHDELASRDVTMNEKKVWAEGFEASRPHLRSVAYRLLGSKAEAEDAVQETWLRLARAEPDAIENLRGWLTTVVARVCL